MLSLDVQTGKLESGDRISLQLNAQEMGLLYWSALDAPASRISRSIGIPENRVQAARQALSERLGAVVTELPKQGLRLKSGSLVKSAYPWPERTLNRLIANGLGEGGDAPFLFQATGEALSRSEVSYLVARIRAGFRQGGLAPGSWVALDATQRVESYLFALATLLDGGRVIRLGDTLGAETLRDSLATVPVTALVSTRPTLFEDRADLRLRVGLDAGASSGVQSFDAWMAACPEPAMVDHEAVSVLPTDVALVGFTSGSTGRPKPVLNPHEALFRSAEVAMRRFGLDGSDLFYTCTDFSASSAFRSMVTLPLMCGGRVLLPSFEARRAPVVAAHECENFGVTRFTAIPNVMRGILKADAMASKLKLTTLRTVFSGSGVLDTPTAQAFRQRFGAQVVDYYGLRETGTALYTDEAVSATIGVGGGRDAECLVRVLDEARTPAPLREIGQVFVLTDCGMLPDLDWDEAGGATTRDPVDWYDTGDLGRVLEDGQVEIVGRKRDIIKAADGTLVFPIEVVSVLCRSQSVREAAVFSIIDAAGIERVAAAVIRSQHGAEQAAGLLEVELRQSVQEASGSYRTPVRVLFLDEFPRVAQRKPNIAQLKLLFEAAFPELSKPFQTAREGQA